MARRDLTPGLTLWAVLVAQSLACARLAHATATAAIVTATAGWLMYALLGSSRRISIGPAIAVAAIVGAAVAGVRPEHLGASLAILTLATGAFLCIAGLVGISVIQRLVPAPVLVGYLTGVGVTILVGQGEDVVAGGTSSIAITGATIATVFALDRLVPKLPASFALLVVATIASALFGLPERGIAVIGSSVGHFTTPALPDGLAWADVRHLIAPAAGLALIVYVDALAKMARADEAVRPRREYFALGAVNLVSGMWGGFVAGTSAIRENTKPAGAIACVLLVITALSIGLLEDMPLAALSGVVCVAALDLVEWRALRHMLGVHRADFWIALVVGAAVVAAGVTHGIALAIVVALAQAFRRTMHPDRLLVTSRAGEHIYEPFSTKALRSSHGVVVYRLGATLFFANAQLFVDDMRRIARHAPATLRRVVVNADALGIPDVVARDALVASHSLLARKGIQLVFGNVHPAQREALSRAGLHMIEEAQFLAAVRESRTSRVQRADSVSGRFASAGPRSTRSP
ncbi:MAG: SulP family inorganic anion transporter [Kofleriaceae bacterium]|nr:SulP family inorganic anion transporter [Kofleriaceae bacterium]